ncbi:RHS repeat-associated core domain-containing protein [Spirulina sp. 06S082]|uniref:RHS repeat domain-containing protein n=1 Tax=Spirulina sp. 06S082 TaxID=3110248 RepID=UPI002B20B47D|nr:RHS repeat-associated core domain-containing protein [Spirulina sp. 06S082]MEA5469586.1 RHS repeat-associated core domain-containing protein [Spirulina sp. 06S082]
MKETLLQPDGTTIERTIDYDYDENDRLMQELMNSQVVVSYTYDHNGNLKTRTEGSETVHYTWDDQNRLVEVQTPNETINYAYDDDNIRVSQTVGTETTSYLLDKNRPYAQVLAEYTNGGLDASYVYGLDLISQERNNVDSYYLVDGLGSTRGLTDSTGNVTDVYSYDAYGNLTDSVGSSENDYLFAGEQFDSNLDQYYLRDRYYDPSVGRFTRRDTYEGNNFNPITLHKYLYANGNPVNNIDPSGLVAMSVQETALLSALVATFAAQRLNTYITTAQNPPERLGGFGEGGLTLSDEDLGLRPRDPRDSLLQRLLSYPGGFGAGQQPDLPTHTGHPPDNTIYEIRHVFAINIGTQELNIPDNKVIKVELVPEGLIPVGRPISPEQARKMVDRGGDIYTPTREVAKEIAGRGAVGPEIHLHETEVRFQHYHRGSKHNTRYGGRGRQGGHIIFGEGR